jgi:hypothetical protein
MNVHRSAGWDYRREIGLTGTAQTAKIDDIGLQTSSLVFVGDAIEHRHQGLPDQRFHP